VSGSQHTFTACKNPVPLISRDSLPEPDGEGGPKGKSADTDLLGKTNIKLEVVVIISYRVLTRLSQ